MSTVYIHDLEIKLLPYSFKFKLVAVRNMILHFMPQGKKYLRFCQTQSNLIIKLNNKLHIKWMNVFVCNLLKKGVSRAVSDDPPKVQGIYYMIPCLALYSIFLFAMELCTGTAVCGSRHQAVSRRNGIVQLPNGPFLFRCI